MTGTRLPVHSAPLSGVNLADSILNLSEAENALCSILNTFKFSHAELPRWVLVMAEHYFVFQISCALSLARRSMDLTLGLGA
jgi:hypothetical protein